MGKRKERRLAAMSGPGRRVKLDLFAEPNGEMDKKPSKEEVTGDPDQDRPAGNPSSPSTSESCGLLGQKQENPLLLLGQYSDDEVNNDAAAEPQVEAEAEAEVEVKVEETLDVNQAKENGHIEENGSLNCLRDQEDNPNEDVAAHDHDTGGDDLGENGIHDQVTNACATNISEAQNTDNPNDGWKVLVDEQTNRYYYWNTLTGETSWEIPDVSLKEATTERENDLIVGTIHDGSQPAEHYSNELMVHTYSSLSHTSVLPDQLGSEDTHHPAVIYNDSEVLGVDPDHILKLGEVLIQRLNALERCDENVERQNWRLRCMWEVETRLADCKALFSFGSALLPFWWHAYTRLKQIEDVLPQEGTSQPDACLSEELPKPDNQDSNVKEAELDVQSSFDPDRAVNATPMMNNAEDVDMDIEMEVDEEPPPPPPSMEQAGIPEHSTGTQSVSIEEGELPPAENWVPPPPPPPEEDDIPPPPPEEPSAQPSPPPSYPVAYPSFSYPEQYAVSAIEYYGPSGTIAPAVAYYAELPEPVAAPLDQLAVGSAVAVVQPVAYYDVPVPISSSSDVAKYSVQPSVELPLSIPVAPSGSQKTESAAAESKPSSSTSVAAQSTGPNPSDAAAVAANVKAPSKVRIKKRTVAVAPTLRSNKRVSNLVDKWKAVKEELHGDEEDEPEDACEALEKKRQKEIEQWKARQIASGEARENANFLPLGGDWRERVKRRRADANAKPSTSGDEAAESSKKQQPDLARLAKGLPSGWQAYWDESSKEVYYGNTRTAETTWIRPSS